MTLPPNRRQHPDEPLNCRISDLTGQQSLSNLEAAQRFAAIVSSSNDAIVSKDLRGIITSWNEAAERMFGYSAEEMTGQSIRKIIPPELQSEEDRILKTIARGERIEHFETIRMNKRGERINISVTISPVKDVDGTIIGAAKIARDITEQKRSEEALRQAQLQALAVSQRLSAIVSSSDDAIVSKDLKGIVTSWNAAAERIFGFTSEEMVGQPILKLIPPDLYGDEERILSTIARGGRIDHFETVRLTKSGKPIEVSITVSPVKDEHGRIVGAAKIARDISQQKSAERSLRTAERLASVGRLAATVAHEINNPLEALTNLIYLARTAALSPEVKQYLTAAEEELHRISLITKQTLGFYRETKAASTTRLGEMTLALLPVFASRARNKSIRVVPEIKDDPEVQAVPGEVRQLIANLISNSIDAVENEGCIRIRVAASRDRKNSRRPGVRLTVADNGTGIAAEVQSQIFTPFFTTKKDVGTGLGLWVCKSIVEKHRGSIRMKSRTSGAYGGTVFSIFLPEQTHQAQSPPILRRAV